MPCRGTARLAQEGHQQLLQLAATPTKRQAPQKALVWKVLKNHLGQGWPKPRPFLWPLFTGVRGSGILRSSFARSCIERSPRVPKMPSKAAHAAGEGTTCCGGA